MVPGTFSSGEGTVPGTFNEPEGIMSASLYDRLGGAAGISGIVDDVVANHLANPAIQARFMAVKDVEHLKKMAREFFCAGSGGPEAYTGRDMLTTHRGMNISEQEYLAVMDDIMAALDKHRIDDVTKRDVLAILYSLKGEIIRV
jgi:hemoglobin